MGSGELRRDSEAAAWWAAVATAVPGATALVGFWPLPPSLELGSNGIGPAVAVLFVSTAAKVFRDSRIAAVLAIGMFVLMATAVLINPGLTTKSVLWTLVVGALLWRGLRGVFTRRPPRSAPAIGWRQPG